MEVGLPPDLKIGIPPPPIPSFLRDPVDYLVSSNGSCDLCGWALGDDDQLAQIITRYPVIEDLWYFGILSAAIGLVLIGVLVFVAALRCREAKVKPVHQESCKNSVSKVHSEPELLQHPISGNSRFDDGNVPKSLWSSLKNSGAASGVGGGGGGYILQHHSVVDPYQLPPPVYEKVDYGSIVYSCPLVPKPSALHLGDRCSPPPLPAVPPPPFCPSLRSKIEEQQQHGVGNIHHVKQRSNPGYYEHLVLRNNDGKQSNRYPMVTRIHERHDGHSAPV